MIPAPVTTEPVKENVLGDVNSDKKVNIFDSVALKRYVLSEMSPINSSNSDMNGDGVVDASDLIQINKFLLNKKW